MAVPAERAVGEVMMPWPEARVANAKEKNRECIMVILNYKRVNLKRKGVVGKDSCK
jgi:hypothetical protein